MSPPQIIRGHVGDMVGYSTVYTSIRMQWMWCMVILVQSNTIRPISGRFLDDGDVGMSNRTRLVWSLVVVSSKSLGMSNRTRLVTFLQVAGFQPYQDLLSSACAAKSDSQGRSTRPGAWSYSMPLPFFMHAGRMLGGLYRSILSVLRDLLCLSGTASSGTALRVQFLIAG